MAKKITTLTCVLLVIVSFIFMPIELNTNGLSTIKELAMAALTPAIDHLPKALEASIITIAYAGAAVSLSILIALTLSFYASGILTSSKTLSNIINRLFGGLRAIHELIWALFLVTVFGLKPMAAILALTLPFVGMLGKVFNDILTQIPTDDIKYLRTSGASRLQELIYGYLPTALPQILSYSLYRFECAIRSSAILSFVGIGGLGLKIQLMLNDLRFNEMFTYVYMMVFIIGLIEIWSNRSRSKEEHQSTIVTGLVIAGFSWFFILINQGGLYDQLINQKNLNYALVFIKKLVGIGSSTTAFTDPNEILSVIKLTIQTLQMSIVAISLAAGFMLFTVLANTKKFSHHLVYKISRAILLFARAIPELIWAMILVFIFKPGLWAGALALAIHNYGIITKLCAEVIESIDNKPLRFIRCAGGSPLHVLLYGVYPSVMKRFISYIIYRWEIILRTTIIVGMVGAGGLGYYFKLHFSLFHYTHITLVIVIYLTLVRLADAISKQLTHVYK